MNKKIWFMEGLSSQRDIIQGVKSFAKKNNFAITVFASHRNERNEILSVADYSLTEPEDPQKRLQFIQETIQSYGIHHIPRFYVSTSKSIIKALINMHSFEIQL
ncbi:hypothetical protein Q4R35_17385, partial [Morganella morganii]